MTGPGPRPVDTGLIDTGLIDTGLIDTDLIDTGLIDTGLIGALDGALRPHADPERAARQQAYMRSPLPFLGLTRSAQRAALRPVLTGRRLDDRAVWAATVRGLVDQAPYREQWYTALELARHRHYREFQDPGTLPLYRDLILATGWWDTVDELAGRHVGGILARSRAETTPVVAAWADADGLWLRRSAVLSQLHHGADTDTDLLAAVLDANLEDSRFGSTFWIRKAVGWALRQHARSDPGWTRAFLADRHDRLSGLSRREAARHIR
ncbi:MAG: DNA alkylation repair protein [Acidimicrobiales bacterium]